jgi:hypothetical protein
LATISNVSRSWLRSVAGISGRHREGKFSFRGAPPRCHAIYQIASTGRPSQFIYWRQEREQLWLMTS